LAEALLGGPRAGRFRALGETLTDPGDYERLRDVAWASGAVLYVLRSCADAVGDWDESFFLYSEETDFCRRARAAGYLVRFEPAATCVHRGGDAHNDPVLWTLLVRNRVRDHNRHHGLPSRLAFALAVLVNELVRIRRSPVHGAAIRGLIRRAPPRPDAPIDGYVCFSAQDWWYHNRAHSDFQLMRRIAVSQPVLLVNSIGMRMPSRGRSTMPLRRIARKVASVARYHRVPVTEVPNFHVLTPVMLPFYGVRSVRRLSAWMVRVQVLRVARRMGIQEAAYVVTLPTAWPVIAPVRRRALLVNRSDKHSSFAEVDEQYISSLERELLDHADVVFYVSRALMEEEAGLCGERARFLDHGVDLRHFVHRDATEEPADLAGIPHPRIGFFGGLDDYIVDFDLLARLARTFDRASIVLVGDATCPLGDLEGLPNVHVLGFRDYEDIPAYGSGFDVALMPWLDNDWIRHCNPIKLKEYLALGLPIVSTAFPEVDRYRDRIRVARTHDEFVALVKLTLEDGGLTDPAARRRAVASASWEGRADAIVNEVRRLRAAS
jgi:glycosyltransferase involved in cell wall biosynthesis